MIDKKFFLKGFTLIELFLTTGLFLILFYLASTSFIQIQRSSLLKDNLWQIATVIRQAQSKASSGININEVHLRHGVLFGADYYQEFATVDNYANREQSLDLQTDLGSNLTFIGLDLPDNCLLVRDCIIFSSLNGVPSGSGSLILKNNTNQAQIKIVINKEGKVSY